MNSLILAPQNFKSTLFLFQSTFFIFFALAIFYIPLRGINQRMVAKKEELQKDVITRIERMFDRIHLAEESENYSQAGGMRNLLVSLKEEREMINEIPTWPWRPSTIRGLLSALFLPTVISLISLVLENMLGL